MESTAVKRLVASEFTVLLDKSVESTVKCLPSSRLIMSLTDVI